MERVEVVFENERVRVERIWSFGCVSAEGFWYEGEWDEWVSVEKGRAVLGFSDKEITLEKGENFYIPARLKHRVLYASEDCEWICVYLK